MIFFYILNELSDVNCDRFALIVVALPFDSLATVLIVVGVNILAWIWFKEAGWGVEVDNVWNILDESVLIV